MEILSLLQEYGAELITAVLDLVTIVLVIKNKPKTAEQVQAIKKKQAEALSKKAERYAEKTRLALTKASKLEEDLK